MALCLCQKLPLGHSKKSFAMLLAIALLVKGGYAAGGCNGAGVVAPGITI